MFRRTLCKEAIGWYQSLPKGSIRTFNDLRSSFCQTFNHKLRRKGKNLALLNMEQGPNETLREYIKRFSIAVHQASSPSDEVATLALILGLKASNFTTKLAKKLPATLHEVIDKAYHEMDVEEMLEGKFSKAREKANNPSTSNNY